MDTFRRFLAAKEAVVERYGLEGDDPQWRQSTCWAGLLIAIGNEFAPGNPASPAEKRRRVEGFTLEPGMAAAIRAGSLDGVTARLGNVLETVTIPDHPEIGRH